MLMPNTVETLTMLNAPVPKSSPLVQLKEGREETAIFLVHGLGGTASFVELANNIKTDNPIYGFQARGLDGDEEPLDRVEDMATLYLEAMAKLHLDGPPILIGYSFGGLVAFEMAQRLSESGKHVALLILLDTYPHPRYLSRFQRFRLIAQRAKFHIDQMMQLPPRHAVGYFSRKVQGRLDIAGSHDHGEYDQQPTKRSTAESSLYVRQRAHQALATYQPRFYPGAIRFITAQTKSFFLPRNPAAIWSNLVEAMTVDAVPGDHLEIVTSQYEGLASVLTCHLQAINALPGSRRRSPEPARLGAES